MNLPALHVPGVLSEQQVRATGDFLLAQQEMSGAIPWWRGGKLDVWDHVESAMALATLGHLPEAEAAYHWLGRTQSPDGSWPMELDGEQVSNDSSDTNQCAYLATGLWHHHLVSGSDRLLGELWPALDAAVGFVLRHQLPGGEVAWAVDGRRRVDASALLTGCSSILHSLTCALQVAQVLGHERPAWQAAGDRLQSALLHRRGAFADRRRYSMDWYYPVLGGALRDSDGWAHLQPRWAEFVIDGRGVRCVADRPWVTGAESAELALALDATGRTEAALSVLTDLQHLRDEETGGYWTGYVVADEAIWPQEQTGWTAAAVVLAADAVTGTTGGSGVFRDYAWERAR